MFSKLVFWKWIFECAGAVVIALKRSTLVTASFLKHINSNFPALAVVCAEMCVWFATCKAFKQVVTVPSATAMTAQLWAQTDGQCRHDSGARALLPLPFQSLCPLSQLSAEREEWGDFQIWRRRRPASVSATTSPFLILEQAHSGQTKEP